MIFPARFYFPFTQDVSLKMCGYGQINLLETGIVIHGQALPFYFPFVTWPLQPIIAQTTFLSVPYSRVIRHRRTTWWSWGHHLHFRDVENNSAAIGFVLQGGRRAADEFSHLLASYREQLQELLPA